MKIFVRAKPNSKKEFVEKISETNLIVAVKEPPVKAAPMLLSKKR
jgi:uncharacterized protein YggU (UPF0235/DUF167 family)